MKEALKPIRRRIRLQRFLRGILWGVLIALAACQLCVVLSFFIPVAALPYMLGGLVAGCMLLGGLLGGVWPVSLAYAARAADQCGLKERAATAVALNAVDTPMARLQRADAQAALAALPLRQAMPLRPARRLAAAAGLLVLVTCGLLLLPNPQHAVLQARAQEHQQREALADTVEEAADKLGEENLTEQEQQELRRITADMAEALRTAEDKRDALEAVDAAEKSLAALERNVRERNGHDLATALDAQPGLKSLSAAMQTESETELAQALSELEAQMETAEGQQELSSQLQAAANTLPAGALQQALTISAEAASAGNSAQAVQALAEAMDAAAGAGQGSGSLAALMRMARSSIAQSGGMGQGNSQGAGAGQGSGTGNNQGGGSGASLGSTNQESKGGSGNGASSQSGGNAPGVERVREYERIYDPTRLGGDSEASYVAGEQHEGEQQQMQLGAGQGSLEGSVPYNQVVGEYQNAAAQSMRRENLPTALQDYVERYFNALIE